MFMMQLLHANDHCKCIGQFQLPISNVNILTILGPKLTRQISDEHFFSARIRMNKITILNMIFILSIIQMLRRRAYPPYYKILLYIVIVIPIFLLRNSIRIIIIVIVIILKAIHFGSYFGSYSHSGKQFVIIMMLMITLTFTFTL